MDDFQTTIMVIMLFLFFMLLIAGATDKVVVYFDVTDLVVSFMPWGSILLGIILIHIYQHGGKVDYKDLTTMQTIVLYSSLFASVAFFVWSIKLSVVHNKSIITGLVVGLFKMLSALLGVMVLAGQVVEFINSRMNRRDIFFTVLVFGVFIWLGKKLINGKRVYLERGWSFP